jgi:recombination protein RecT
MSKIDYTASGKRLTEQAGSDPQALLRQQLGETQRYLDAKLPQLERWITGGVDSRALIRFAMLDMSAPTRAGQKLRECTRESIYMSLLACAVTGLEPGALKGEAFLVPFAGKAQFMIGWRGIVKQARRSRDVVGLTANVVLEHDTFELDLASGGPPVHRPLLRGPRGEIIGAYAVATFASGHREVEWMDREDLDAVKKVATSRGESDAWKGWEDQMFRKAPIRRIAKRLPLGADYYIGLAVEHAHDEGKTERDVLDIVTDGEASKTDLHAGAAASMRAQAMAMGGEEPTAEELAEIARLEREEP